MSIEKQGKLAVQLVFQMNQFIKMGSKGKILKKQNHT